MAWWNRKKNDEVIVYNAEMQHKESIFGAILNSLSTLRGSSGGIYGISPDGKRDYNKLYGYGTNLTYDDYLGLYKRGGIAKTVVAKVAKACWRERPQIKIGEKEILEEEMKILHRKGFFKAMEKADILNRIGSFSILILGLPDGEDLDKPLGTVGGGNPFDGIYFNAYGYNGIEIIKWDREPSSARFGLPVIYQLKANTDPNNGTKDINTTTFKVHWSRVIHMNEGALDSSIEGESALEGPWNALVDKDKVRGGSGEAYFRNSRQKLALETEKDAQLDLGSEAVNKLKENVEGFQNGWEDTLRLNKMKANMLQPSLVSPRDTFDICVEEVSGTTGIPIRVLTTKGGGNLIGTEDKASWNALIADRDEQECTPWLLRALSIYSEAGMLDLPDGVEVIWPPQKALSEKEATEAMANKARAFKDTVDALSAIGADDVVASSVFKAIGFEDVEIDDIDLSDEDDDIDKDLPPQEPEPEE